MYLSPESLNCIFEVFSGIALVISLSLIATVAISFIVAWLFLPSEGRFLDCLALSTRVCSRLYSFDLPS